MQNIKIFTRAVAAVALMGAFTTSAQTFHLPKAHTSEHSQLIAKQSSVANQVSVQETRQFLDNLFREETEPEKDIYTEGWASKRVNAYAGMQVPDRKVIDVSEYCMPVPGYITSPYGYRPRFKREHKGVDLKLSIGDTVRAAFDGKIRLTNFERNGYGYYVIARHDNGLETVYGHLSKFLVKPDQYVRRGQPIALGGNTGRSTGPHLHFETRFMGVPINPSAIFDFANQTTHTDTYTFDKRTYKQARNFDPAATKEYQERYQAQHRTASAAGTPTKRTDATSSAKKSKQNKTTASTSVKVKRGDTLSKVAQRNGITVKQLCRLNGIKSSAKIKAGSTLRIK